MDAETAKGVLTTRPVVFTGKLPFVNVAAGHGELRTEILDAVGKVIAPFSEENSVAVRADSTKERISWKGAADLSSLAGKSVRFRFHLTNAQIYAFWVSAGENGASGGYVAGGGPGFNSLRDR